MEPRADLCIVTLGVADVAKSATLRAGARSLKKPQRAFWGGYSGYFADPDGYPWEVAFNPNFPIGEDGRLRID